MSAKNNQKGADADDADDNDDAAATDDNEK